MKKVVLFVLIVFLLLPLAYSFGLEEKDKNPSESLDLSVDEALSILKNFDPNIKVTGVQKSPVGGLWEVDIESGGKKNLVYVDSSKKYLISGGIISVEGKKNLTQERLTELKKVDVSKIPLDNAIVMGDKEAKNRIIVFTDPV
jgi:thiol:disulfide interchange protein DsbC